MAYYRLYQLRGPSNEVETFDEFQADSDVAAITVAEACQRTNAMELWQNHRKVQRWESVLSANGPTLAKSSRP